MKRAGLFLTVFILMVLLPAALFAQKKESLAVFAFTGGSASDGEAIASSLTRQATLRNAFNKTTLVTRSTIAAMNFEQRFQRNSGLTDADSIFELGKQLNASHVIAGNITRLGDRNLVLVSIMDVESLQQIAGDYRTYRTIEEIDALIPSIAQKLAVAVPRNTANLPGLSVPPFNILSGVNQNEAMVLAQILACELANSGKYAVLPRTDSIDKVMEEQRRQRTGVTDQERVRLLGVGRNALYVLSGSVQRLGTLNKFTADILNILDGSFIDGHEESYSNIADGLTKMADLSGKLTGVGGPDNFVRINGGTFTMGSPASESGRGSDEGPQRQVTVSSFNIGKYQVTQKEYEEIMGTNPSNFKGSNLPVERVSWFDAIEYCNRRSQRENLTPAYTISGSGDNRTVTWNRNANGYRLPTEAEWEYACRAGTTTAYNTGASINDNTGWYTANSAGSTQEVGKKPPNAWGLYDMHGNVWEWCWDWYASSYPSGAQTDPIGASSGSIRVFRGGSWSHSATAVRSAYRSYRTPSDRVNFLGFRLVRP
jgi:formylglycine-generating enzyme required for sulfatase activity/TolB-like protein